MGRVSHELIPRTVVSKRRKEVGKEARAFSEDPIYGTYPVSPSVRVWNIACGMWHVACGFDRSEGGKAK